MHRSLAVLETLIHTGGRKIPPRALTRIEIPERVGIESAEWLDMPLAGPWRRLGEGGANRGVPSMAVNRMESNFVLNPAHPHFAGITPAPAPPFAFNPGFFAM